jgi:hypothetical protein
MLKKTNNKKQHTRNQPKSKFEAYTNIHFISAGAPRVFFLTNLIYAVHIVGSFPGPQCCCRLMLRMGPELQPVKPAESL